MSVPVQDKKIRLLFLGKDATRGGGQRIQLYILKYLDADKFESQVALANDGPLLPEYSRYARTFVYAPPAPDQWTRLIQRIVRARPGRRGQRHLKTLVQMRLAEQKRAHQARWILEVMRQFRPHLLVRNFLYPIPAFESLEKCKVSSIQNVFLKGAQCGLEDRALQTVVRGSNHFICEGIGTHNYIMACWGLAGEQISTVCIGVDAERCAHEMQQPERVRREELGIAEDAIVIGTAGSIHFLKGMDLWVEMAATLKSRYPNQKLKFIWVGSTGWGVETVYKNGVQKLIRKLNLEQDILLVGDQPQVFPYLDLCDIYVQPSRNDAFPHATLEAMLLGKPVVSSREGIALERYAQDSLIPVESESATALAEGVARLVDDSELRLRLGRSGQTLVHERFEITDTVRQYGQVLEQIFRTQVSHPN